MRSLCIAFVVLSSFFAAACTAQDSIAPVQEEATPRLVVQIVVDQLRGDIPFRYRDRLGPDGFRRLMDGGTWYTAAQHPHSHTETIVGHTTLSTAAYPSSHGMIANSWYERDAPVVAAVRAKPKRVDSTKPKKKLALGTLPPYHGMSEEVWTKPETGHVESAVESSDYVVVGTTDEGASPEDILTSTFGDELSLSTHGRGKVFSVSNKDRAAVALGGHAGKAFWYSANNGHHVSSTYYYQQGYPAWVDAWNAEERADAFKNTEWQLSRPLDTYLFRDSTNRFPAGSPPEKAMEMLDKVRYNRVFPHKFVFLEALPPQMFYTGITISPIADELTMAFAEAVVENEQLGADDITDYLGIGLSAFDIVNHWFSISSLESEDNLLRLDQRLAQLFAFLDEKVGPEHYVIVLSGDHGGPEFPENLEKPGITTGRIDPNDIEAAATAALTAGYEDGADLLTIYQHPYFYLDLELIAARGLNRAEVEQTVVQAVMALDGIALAVGATELARGGEEASAELIARIRRNQHPDRSGDVYVVQEPQWQVSELPSTGEGSTNVVLLNHGSPWAYDRFVPVAFYGASIPAAKVAREIATVDVSATLAAMIGTGVPSGSVGTPLPEVLDDSR